MPRPSQQRWTWPLTAARCWSDEQVVLGRGIDIRGDGPSRDILIEAGSDSPTVDPPGGPALPNAIRIDAGSRRALSARPDPPDSDPNSHPPRTASIARATWRWRCSSTCP